MKTFILDTNVILHDPNCFTSFKNNKVIIPLPVLDELDSAKVRPDALGRNAREAIRLLDGLRSKGSLSKGVLLRDVLIRVELNYRNHVPSGLSLEKKDNRIIGVALGIQKDGGEVIVISKDINLRVKCDALGLQAQDYESNRVAEAPSSIYSGVETVETTSDEIDKLFKNGELPWNRGYPNQFFLLKSAPNHVGIGRYIGGKLKLVKPPKDIQGISPRNLEQRMAADILLDPTIKLVTLVGRAGSGKTLMAVAAGLKYVINDAKTYNRMLISRPIQPMGKDLGFLPGSVEDKLDPWMQPLYDNLELLLGGDRQMLDMYKDQGIIQLEALTYIRGRSIPKSFMIVDEAQNLQPQEIKTIITRVGEGTKIVITGDIEQIDNPYVDFADNGLTHVIEKFKDHAIAGHMTLNKCERSELAELGAQIL